MIQRWFCLAVLHFGPRRVLSTPLVRGALAPVVLLEAEHEAAGRVRPRCAPTLAPSPGTTWPAGPDVQVLLDGLDVFRTPADDILAHATRKGWQVNNDDPRAPYIPAVTLAFTRDTSQDVPRGENGLQVHFTSVLVADEKYRTN